MNIYFYTIEALQIKGCYTVDSDHILSDPLGDIDIRQDVVSTKYVISNIHVINNVFYK